MALFQNSVLRNYLTNIDEKRVLQAYDVYKIELLEIKANIRHNR